MNDIIMYEIQQEVKVRKYPVDIVGLQQLLRSHKRLSNKEIAATLDIPLTLVAHWFRTDKCFAIPTEDLWPKLKTLLYIEETRFDKSIMEFETKPGVYDMANRFYDSKGIAPTITCGCDEKIIEYVKDNN